MQRLSQPGIDSSTEAYWPVRPMRERDLEGLLDHVVSRDAGTPPVGADQRGQHPDDGGLPGTVGPEQTQHGAGRDRQAYPVHRPVPAELLD